MASLIRSIYLRALKILARPALRNLRPTFNGNNPDFRKLLLNRGFSPVLVSCPALMFESSQIGRYKKPGPFTALWIDILKKGITSGSLICPKGENILREAGVNSVFVSKMGSILDTTPVSKYSVPEGHRITGKIVVFSVLTGQYDNPHEILFKNPDVDYLLFTNNRSVKSDTWTVVYVESPLDNKLLSRDIKINPHKYLDRKYSASIYVDANVSLYGDITELCGFLDDNISFAVTRHSERDSVKKEIAACIEQKGTDPEEAWKQYEKYLEAGFTDTFGLAECTILVRRHSDYKLCALMELWWEEYLNGIKRDQVSLPYCIEMSGFMGYRIMEGNVFRNQFCIAGGHNQAK